MPELLLLGEAGCYEDLPWWRNPEIEDGEWISEGWQAREYGGHSHFQHEDKAVVQQWLAEHGYQDTGDGAHYRKLT